MSEIYNGVIANLYETSELTVEGVIHNCTQIIERSETVAGAGKRMENPMLSIFLGEQAVAHKPEIQDVYYSCWSDHANHLISLMGKYSRETIEEAIFKSTQVEDRTLKTDTVRTVWFWDIMDDDFDTYFECVKTSYAMPVATANKRVYFIFCSQRNTLCQEKTRARLKEKLIPWALENQFPLVILSDATSRGILHVNGVAENYRLAANLMLVMNSHYAKAEDNLGKAMAFDLERDIIFSASYYGCKKNFFDIVGVSLLTIIERYRALGTKKNESYSYSNSVQDRLCGMGKDYYDLIEDIFDATLAGVCQVDARLWGDLPVTEAATAMQSQLSGEKQKGGFWQNLFRGARREVSAQEVIAGYGDFWNCCLERYYLSPVEAYLSSPKGQQAVKDHMYSRMTAVLNYDEMHELLAKESRLVRTLMDDLESKLSFPAQEECRNIGELLHAWAMRSVKLQVAKRLLDWLAEAMMTLCQNAFGFDALLKKVQNSLPKDQMERSVVRAYSYHMEQLIDSNPQLLTRYIRPSEKESELLRQLQTTFEELIKTDPQRLYYKSLQDDLQFRIENAGAAAAVNVIAECFRFDMAHAGRLPSLVPSTVKLYTIMNNTLDLENLAGHIPQDAIGERFVVSRSDRIERLGLFHVAPDSIMYSNEHE